MTLPSGDVALAAGVSPKGWLSAEAHEPNENLHPGQHVPVIRMNDSNEPVLHTMRWGLVPEFTKKSTDVHDLDFFRMFNARSESCHEKSVFSR
jgi:putative SOS response-associated peptidase YedK